MESMSQEDVRGRAADHPMRVAVTGASGWIGRELVSCLVGRGHRVVTVGRSPEHGSVDLARETSLAALARRIDGVDCVVHAAAHVHRPHESDAERALFQAVNVDGTRRVVRTCEDVGVARLVYVSTIAVHGFGDARPRREDEPAIPSTEYGRTKLRGEQIALDSHLDVRIARLSTVFGRGDDANFKRLATALRRGLFAITGRGTGLKSVIAVDDAAFALTRLAEIDELANRTFHLAAPEPVSLEAICAAFARVCGFREPPVVPLAWLELGARVGDLVLRPVPRAPSPSALLQKLVRDTVVDTTRFAHAFPEVRIDSFERALARHADRYRNA